MDREYIVVLSELQNHIGKDKAIYRKDLLYKVNEKLDCKLSDRALRQIKADLNLNYGQYICSNPSLGYWIASCYDDIRIVRNFLLSYIKELSKEAKAIKRNYIFNNGEQKQLELI